MAALIEKKKRKTKKNLIKNIFKYSQAQIKHVQDAACNVQAGMHGSIWSGSRIGSLLLT
jgi:hypothetical protein